MELGIRQPSLLVVGIIQAGELLPAFHGPAGVSAGVSVGKPGIATRLLSGSAGEQPRLGLLECVDVAAVVCQNRPRGLHVAHASELQLKADSVGLALGLELYDMTAQLLGRLCVLGGLCCLRFKRGNLLVALGNGLLPVGADHLWLLLRRLPLPEVFLGLRLFLRLCAMCITCHIGPPFSSADSSRRPAPDSYGYWLSMRHKFKMWE